MVAALLSLVLFMDSSDEKIPEVGRDLFRLKNGKAFLLEPPQVLALKPVIFANVLAGGNDLVFATRVSNRDCEVWIWEPKSPKPKLLAKLPSTEIEHGINLKGSVVLFGKERQSAYLLTKAGDVRPATELIDASIIIPRVGGGAFVIYRDAENVLSPPRVTVWSSAGLVVSDFRAEPPFESAFEIPNGNLVFARRSGQRTFYFVQTPAGSVPLDDKIATAYFAEKANQTIFYSQVQSQVVPSQSGDFTRDDLAVMYGSPESAPATLPLAYIAFGAEEGDINESGTLAFYLHSGVLFGRTIRLVSPAEFDRYERERTRIRAVRQAQQVATAFMFYMSENDDALPPNVTGWQEKPFPYARDRGLVASFVYTFQVGPRSGTGDELGYILTPHGKAVAMADGSVRWVPKG